MLAYVGVDAAVGSVPVVGTIIDAVLKVNKRNVELARRDIERQRTPPAGDRWSPANNTTPIEIEIEVEDENEDDTEPSASET